MPAKPQRRSHGVVFEKLDDGAVIYDSDSKRAHSLDHVATRVFAAADGSRSVAEIGAHAGLDEACVHAALDQLGSRGLLVPASTVSRRAVLKRTGAIGAAAIAAAPLIETMIIPAAAAHASSGSNPGGGGNPTPPPAPPYEANGTFYFTPPYNGYLSDVVNGNGNYCPLDVQGFYYPAHNPPDYTPAAHGCGSQSAAGYLADFSPFQLYYTFFHGIDRTIYYSSDTTHAIVVANGAYSWTVYYVSSGGGGTTAPSAYLAKATVTFHT